MTKRPRIIESADTVPLLEPPFLTALSSQAADVLAEYSNQVRELSHVCDALEEALNSEDPDVLMLAQVQFFAYLSMALLSALRETRQIANTAANQHLTSAGQN